MKKSTIKRRKRVVPAYPDTPRSATGLAQQTLSTSPEPVSPEQQSQHEDRDTTPAPKRKRAPPTVDYTGYVPQSPTSDTSRQPQKTAEDYTVQLQLAAAAAEGMQLDPALVDASRGGRRELDNRMSQPTETREGDSTVEEDRRAERRAQLMREAEVMRAALRAKEREIDDLT